LKQFNAAILRAFVNRHSVRTNAGEDNGLTILEMVVELSSKQGLTVIFLHETRELVQRFGC